MSKKVNLAIIGLGGRGMALLKGELLKNKDIEVVCVCDSYEDRANDGYNAVKKAKGTQPFKTTNYKDIIGRDGVDVVFISTAWEHHIDIAVEAMEAKQFVAMEVGGAYCIEDCWKIVDAYERTKTPLMLLENCCYGKYELMALRMVREGLFGDIVHCEGGYMHDLRREISNGKENRHYRLKNYLERNCENYPTHELGPIAKILDINRGNRLVSLASFDSKSMGLHDYILRKKAKDTELVNAKFKQGDVITTIIKTSQGQTITLSLDTTLPRTYSRHFTIRGTKGAYFEDNNSVFIDGRHNMYEFSPSLLWNNAKRYARKYAHSIWKNKGKLGKGHGGMDTLVIRAMVEAFQNGYYPPIDVYDTATWMAVTALSDQSIKNNGAVVDFPDFTRGKWENRQDKCLGKYGLDK